MARITVEIKNELGLHARPAAFFVKKASEFASRITVAREGRVVNGKSLLDIMTLAARKGTVITIQAQGTDEEEAVAALARLIEDMADKFTTAKGGIL